VHHVGILYDQFMMHGQRNIKPFSLVRLKFGGQGKRLIRRDHTGPKIYAPLRVVECAQIYMKLLLLKRTH